MRIRIRRSIRLLPRIRIHSTNGFQDRGAALLIRAALPIDIAGSAGPEAPGIVADE